MTLKEVKKYQIDKKLNREMRDSWLEWLKTQENADAAKRNMTVSQRIIAEN